MLEGSLVHPVYVVIFPGCCWPYTITDSDYLIHLLLQYCHNLLLKMNTSDIKMLPHSFYQFPS
jgi:hypothetical protein